MAIFSEGRAEFRRHDEGIDTHTKIVVSPEDDIELRRLRITNSSRAQRTIEVTTYSEIVLAPAIARVLARVKPGPEPAPVPVSTDSPPG